MRRMKLNVVNMGVIDLVMFVGLQFFLSLQVSLWNSGAAVIVSTID
jgi:hypothetical protein